jgi:hypothetical protein
MMLMLMLMLMLMPRLELRRNQSLWFLALFLGISMPPQRLPCASPAIISPSLGDR